jgi:hypothetical protein
MTSSFIFLLFFLDYFLTLGSSLMSNGGGVSGFMARGESL